MTPSYSFFHRFLTYRYVMHLKNFFKACWLHNWNKKCQYLWEKNVSFLRILWMSHYQLEEMSNLQRWKQPYWLSFPRVSMWFPKGQQLRPMSILLTLTLMSSSRKGEKRSCYFNKLPTSLSTSISLTTFFAPSINLHCKCLQGYTGTL